MSDSERRFKELIEPLKDLAANWDIDIADSLNVYLEELEGLQITIDGSANSGMSSLNFAEAALLIQGSTSIYSRKVEYLHKLVMQSLEHITNQKTGTQSSGAQHGKGKYGMNTTMMEEERLLFGTDPSYLLLDDIVEEAENIELILPQEAANNQQTKNRRRNSSRLSMSGEFSRNSMVLMHSILHEDHGSTSLKMSSCKMDLSGALVIGGLSHQLEEEVVRGDIAGMDVGIALMEDMVDGGDHHGNDIENYHENNNDFDYDNGYDNDYSASDSNNFDGGAVAPLATMLNPPTLPTRGAAEPIVTRPLTRSDEPTQILRRKQVTAADAMRLLDPHEVTTDSRPISKGRTFVIPKRLILSDKLQELRKRNNNNNNAAIIELIAKLDKISTDDHELFKKSLGSIGHYTDILDPSFEAKKIPMHGFICPSMKQIAKIYRSRQQQQAMLSRRRAAELADLDDDDDDDFIYRNAEDHILDVERNVSLREERIAAFESQGNYNDDDDVGGFWGDDMNNYDEDNAPAVATSLGAAAAAGDIASSDQADIGGSSSSSHSSSDNDLVNDMERNVSRIFDEDEVFARRVERALEDGIGQTQSNSYEMLCRKHIENFMRGADLYARETQLSKRVNDWTAKLEPVLRNQELAPAFDIHQYSDRMLSQFSEISTRNVRKRQLDDKVNNKPGSQLEVPNVIRFEEVVVGQPREEVCRAFLACLQLANLGNIRVVPPGLASTFGVELVTTNKQQDIENYFAPSVHQNC